MQELKDPAIKLFGKEIPLSSNEVSGGGRDGAACSDTSSVEREEEIETDELVKDDQSIQDTPPDSVTLDESAEPKSSDGSGEKAIKKPDKILPCPRCNSKDTKFCYYNNYNVNQPRHFCKSCQRYWTAGGTMRNMPVGAGRRKSKSSSSHYRHITITEALQAAHGSNDHNGIVLKFGGVDRPIHEAMAGAINGTNKKAVNGGVFHSPRSVKRGFSNSKGENCDDCSSGSTISAMSSNDDGSRNANFHPQIPEIPPWSYPLNYPTVLPPSTLCPPGFGMPFYPAAFLNCSFHNNWNFPLMMPSNDVPDSRTLGQHPRDGEILDSENPAKRRNGSVLVPKTLRVNDPNDAAKSTIWSTLGIKNDSLCKEGFFKVFDRKNEDKVQSPEKPPPALLSNPAALSRLSNFLERSSASA